ncbi:MAG: carboxypeptidase-like regulatory domain-containing protein [Bacteroidales bacterium]|nr:carboxypeptidase-like regulatory domain-containing protein [Bacteroidales bacterium]
MILSTPQLFALATYSGSTKLASVISDEAVVVDQQQERKISGKVLDQSGIPLPGVSVVIKGTNSGALTDINGNFSLSVPDGAKTVSFSFVGMNPQDLEIGTQSVFNITMEESSIGLEEVVVIGYGTVKKSSLAAAVATLKNDKLNQIAVGRADLAIVGQLPGISVKQISTRPGEAPVIRIRGVSSITGANDPLYVVDDVPIIWDLNSVNAGDIESIEVLKDASSAAIYGSRAAAGVVMAAFSLKPEPGFEFKSTALLLPIPNREINLYPALEQNQGYY